VGPGDAPARIADDQDHSAAREDLRIRRDVFAFTNAGELDMARPEQEHALLSIKEGVRVCRFTLLWTNNYTCRNTRDYKKKMAMVSIIMP